MHLTSAAVTAVVGAMAFVGAMAGVRLRWRADQRDAWWQRAQWAMDRSFDDDPDRRHVGANAMLVLAGDRGASATDLDVLDGALARASDIAGTKGDTGRDAAAPHDGR